MKAKLSVLLRVSTAIGLASISEPVVAQNCPPLVPVQPPLEPFFRPVDLPIPRPVPPIVQLTCSGPSLNTMVGQAGVQLLQRIPNGGADDAIWGIGDVRDISHQTDFTLNRGTAAIAAIGIDRTLGKQDPFSFGGAIAAIRVRSELAIPSFALRNQLSVDGLGGLAYVNYRASPGQLEGLQLRLSGLGMVLDNKSISRTTAGVSLPKGSRGGQLYAIDFNATYVLHLAYGENSFLAPNAGVRTQLTRFSDPAVGNRSDVEVYTNLFGQHEIVTNALLLASVGVSVPLTAYQIGIDPDGPTDLRRQIGAIFEYRLGFRVQASRRLELLTNLVGRNADGIRDIGGFIRIRYFYDRRKGS